MNGSARFEIDFSRQFPRFESAPIVEAVFRFSARAERVWDASPLDAALASRLPSYVDRTPVYDIRLEIESTEKTAASRQPRRSSGIRLASADGKNVVRFGRDGVVISRLKPYTGWETFASEVSVVWQAYKELACPSQIDRMDVRFVNLIPGISPTELAGVLREPPSRPVSLPLTTFLDQSTFDVPDRHLGVQVVKTVKSAPGPGLILDVDVFTKRSSSADGSDWQRDLPAMRWLKNCVFFELLTPEAVKRLEEAR